MTEFTGKEVTVFRVSTFLNEVSAKFNFLGIYEILNIPTKYQQCKSELPNKISIRNNKF